MVDYAVTVFPVLFLLHIPAAPVFLVIVVFGEDCVEAIEDEAKVFVSILLTVPSEITAAFPATLKHMHSAVAFVLLGTVEIRENVV